MTLGDFTGLHIDDLTATYGKLSSGRMSKDAVNNIILHQTGSAAGADTLRAYKKRIAEGSTIGAHYLIDENGDIKLVVPVDKKVSHVGKTKPGFETASNPHAIGVEHAGKPLELDVPANATDTATLTTNRADIKAFTMSPQLKARILAMTDKQLYALARANTDPNKDKWYVYGDLSAKQKRSSYLLDTQLMTEFGLSEGDFLAHETVSWKTIGEGENIKEFLTARLAYPGLVNQLDIAMKGDPALAGNSALVAILSAENSTVDALAKDATETENATLAAEKTAGKPGVASKREALRVSYYQKFWTRQTQLKDLVTFLQSAGSSKPKELAKKLGGWVP
jgi:hypothetical protein